AQVQLDNQGLLDDSDQRITYGGWDGQFDLNASGRAYRMSSTAGDTVSFAFTGPTVTWTTVTGPIDGKAKVSIDGVSKGTVDLYPADFTFGVREEFTGLTNTQHTITISVLGKKNPSSFGTFVSVDGFAARGTKAEENAPTLSWSGWSTGSGVM